MYPFGKGPGQHIIRCLKNKNCENKLENPAFESLIQTEEPEMRTSRREFLIRGQILPSDFKEKGEGKYKVRGATRRRIQRTENGPAVRSGWAWSGLTRHGYGVDVHLALVVLVVGYCRRNANTL